MRGHEASDWYRRRAEEARELRDAYQALEVEARRLQQEAAEQEVKVRKELAEVYLPQLTAEALARTAKITGFSGFQRRDPLKAMAHELKVLQRRIAEILADETYQRRQWLVGPEGELTRGRQEAWELFEPWQQDAARYEDLPGFMELIFAGYDTPRFETSWFEPAYWRMWAAGDRICEELGVGDFGDDVLPEYGRVAGERDKWKVEVASWDARIDAVHALVREHDEAVARIPRLPEIYLQGCHEVLGAFLEHADAGLLDAWAQQEDPPDRAVRMGLRRLAGVKAKVEFFEELITQGIATAAESFELRARKYDRKVAKYRRPKHSSRRISHHEIDSKFEQKRPKYHERVDKLRKLMDRLHRYDHYERFDLDNEPELWWVEMTRKPPGSFTPRLRHWYAKNQGARPVHDDSLDLEGLAAAAAAEAASAEDDLGYLS